ncbi:coagulation factor XIII B chain-like isoform X2 [Hyperolius riggenbachi]|uniref:coagulation factor XIII B chain-like isoform X2 n=1 Tax=Hyperolius riggenbachi TaxID=752182 RepID=UPI0035A2E42B
MSARWSLLMIAICLLYRLGSSSVSAQTTGGCQRPFIENSVTDDMEYYDMEYYDINEEVTVWCNIGYYPLSQTTTCVTNKRGDRHEWYPAVTCTAGCQRPSIGNMLSVTGDKEYYTADEWVTVWCNTGYYPTSQRTRCMKWGDDRPNWYPAVICRVTAGCQRPSMENMRSVPGDKEYYDINEEVTIWCNTGYYPKSQTMICVTNSRGDRHEWYPAVTCTAVCERPSIENMYNVTGNKQYYTINEEVTVQCNPGYYPSSQRTRCVKWGDDRPQWYPAVTCTGVTVTDVAITSNNISIWTSCSPECPSRWRFNATCCDETTSPPSCNSSSNARNVTFPSLKSLALYKITLTVRTPWETHPVWSSNVTTTGESDLPRERKDNDFMLPLLLWILIPFLLLLAVALAVIQFAMWIRKKRSKDKTQDDEAKTISMEE